MIYYQNETKQNMFNSYNNMTPVERSIADFFLSNTEKMDFSSKTFPNVFMCRKQLCQDFRRNVGIRDTGN